MQHITIPELELGDEGFWPGDRVLVFDHRLYLDDRTTPPFHTFRPATVIQWYGTQGPTWVDWPSWNYESLIDVVFDHDGRTSKGHFTTGVRKIT